ncbi:MULTISPECIES: hypothetical protein [unclassified Mycobacterium]|uniref:hypothetical protein n=1 Tax=unclassified Mycobacterium TaxID=2642494 RepID=UPI0029C9590F|nr:MULTISPECIES: hypothetical protein [unclassified Mycobacterium]
MAIAVAAKRQALADAYGSDITHEGLSTADPGTSSTPASEVAGGTPAYARKATTPSAGSGGVENFTACIFDVPAGTYAWGFFAGGVTGNSMKDKFALASTTFVGQATLTVTATYTQT